LYGESFVVLYTVVRHAFVQHAVVQYTVVQYSVVQYTMVQHAVGKICLTVFGALYVDFWHSCWELYSSYVYALITGISLLWRKILPVWSFPLSFAAGHDRNWRYFQNLCIFSFHSRLLRVTLLTLPTTVCW
jgi:hypothetical protein